MELIHRQGHSPTHRDPCGTPFGGGRSQATLSLQGYPVRGQGMDTRTTAESTLHCTLPRRPHRTAGRRAQSRRRCISRSCVTGSQGRGSALRPQRGHPSWPAAARMAARAAHERIDQRCSRGWAPTAEACGHCRPSPADTVRSPHARAWRPGHQPGSNVARLRAIDPTRASGGDGRPHPSHETPLLSPTSRRGRLGPWSKRRGRRSRGVGVAG